VRRLFIIICIAAPTALLTGCADLSRPEQITVVAEKPPAPPVPDPVSAAAAAVRAQAAGAMPGAESGAPQARAGGG
jgi:hypothetical protein